MGFLLHKKLPQKITFPGSFSSILFLQQLVKAGCEERAELPFQKAVLEGELPYTVGGGIGQSRICMFFLRKAHIGEVQASIWQDGVRAEAEAHNIHLL